MTQTIEDRRCERRRRGTARAACRSVGLGNDRQSSGVSCPDVRGCEPRVCEAAETSVPGLALGDAGELDRRPVGESRDERQAVAHGLDRLAQR